MNQQDNVTYQTPQGHQTLEVDLWPTLLKPELRVQYNSMPYQ